MQDQGPPAQKCATDSDINWVRTFFMIAFHIEAVAALFFFSLGFVSRNWALVDMGELGHWDGISPATHASRLSSTQVGGVFPDLLRHAESRRWADFLGLLLTAFNVICHSELESGSKAHSDEFRRPE